MDARDVITKNMTVGSLRKREKEKSWNVQIKRINKKPFMAGEPRTFEEKKSIIGQKGVASSTRLDGKIEEGLYSVKMKGGKTGTFHRSELKFV